MIMSNKTKTNKTLSTEAKCHVKIGICFCFLLLYYSFFFLDAQKSILITPKCLVEPTHFSLKSGDYISCYTFFKSNRLLQHHNRMTNPTDDVILSK